MLLLGFRAGWEGIAGEGGDARWAQSFWGRANDTYGKNEKKGIRSHSHPNEYRSVFILTGVVREQLHNIMLNAAKKTAEEVPPTQCV